MAISARITAERLLLLGWSRAILLQVAHPLIAAGVFDHSGFRASPLAAASRLHHTVAAMLAIAFGGEAASARAIAGIRAIHARVHGTLRETVGPFPAGTPYSAEDPALVLWVHATLVESMIVVFDRFVAPLTAAERDAYCAEVAWIAVALGAGEEQVPRTWRDTRDCVDRTLASGAIVVGPQAREVSRALLWPSLARALPGSGWLNRLITAALLPAQLRAQYGLSATDRQLRFAGRIADVIRGVRSLAPRRVATWAASRRHTAVEPG